MFLWFTWRVLLPPRMSAGAAEPLLADPPVRTPNRKMSRFFCCCFEDKPPPVRRKLRSSRFVFALFSPPPFLLTASPCPQLTEEQKREQRAQLADAAEARSKNFNQARLSEDSPPSRVIILICSIIPNRVAAGRRSKQSKKLLRMQRAIVKRLTRQERTTKVLAGTLPPDDTRGDGRDGIMCDACDVIKRVIFLTPPRAHTVAALAQSLALLFYFVHKSFTIIIHFPLFFTPTSLRKSPRG